LEQQKINEPNNEEWVFYSNGELLVQIKDDIKKELGDDIKKELGS
jgi:hypothetical protein